MSAPDPEKWKASVGEIEDAAYEADSEYGNGDSGEIVKLTETVARRRVLAELKAIRDAYPEQTQALHDRIAAIEAEEA